MAAILERVAQAEQLSEELAALSAHIQRSVLVVRGSQNGTGSGVLWDADGLVVTNHHVVPHETAHVEAGSGQRLPARVVARSRRLDLAALQVEGDLAAEGQRPAAVGDSTQLRVGQLVVAVGNPLGERNAVTLGVVTATRWHGWRDGMPEAIPLAITLRPGNSGGALADVHGRVIGIPNMVVRPGVALAVPSRVVGRFLLRGEAGSMFGVVGRWVELQAPVVARAGLAASTGFLVLEVVADSPAVQAGLVVGDVLVLDASSDDTGGPAPRPLRKNGFEELFGRLRGQREAWPSRLAVLRGGILEWMVLRASNGELARAS